MRFTGPRTLAAIAWLILTSPTMYGDETESVDTVTKPIGTPAQVTAIVKSDAVTVGALDLFDAINRDLVEARFIPIGAHKATVVIRNKTGNSIDLDLPSAFGARHILGQFGQGAGGGIGFGGGGGGAFGQGGAGGFGQGGQNLGGGFGQGNGGQGAGQGNGFGQGLGFGQGGGQQAGFGQGNGGFFRIKPDKKRRIVVQTVCLEHGKRDPNPRMQYAIVPLKRLTTNPATRQLCQDLSTGRITQQIAQATTWKLENGLSWETLAALNRRESRWLGNEARFAAKELQQAKNYLQQLLPRAESSSEGNLTGGSVLPAEAARAEGSPSVTDVGTAMTPDSDSNPWGLRYR